MKNTFLMTAVMIAAILLPNLAQAQSKIAVVDIRLLLTESKAAKSIQSQIKERRDSFVNDLASEEKKLRGMEKTLIEQKAELSQEDFVEKRQDFEKELIDTRKEATEKRRDLEEAAAKASQKLRDEITTIVQEVADESEYDLVLSMQDVVIGSNTLNITDEVLKRLNKNVSKISVKF